MGNRLVKVFTVKIKISVNNSYVKAPWLAIYIIALFAYYIKVSIEQFNQ